MGELDAVRLYVRGQLLSGFDRSAMSNQSLKSGSWILILVVVNLRSKIYRIDILDTYFHYMIPSQTFMALHVRG